MAKPGPKPEPTYLKVVKGNPGKRPLNPREARFDPVNPAPPAHLGRHGKAEWKRLAPLLASRGLLTAPDLGTFEALCEAYDDWRTASADVKKHGLTFKTPNGYEQIRPTVAVKTRARDAYVKIGSDFGLSPAERGRLELPVEHGGDVDPMEAALGGTRRLGGHDVGTAPRCSVVAGVLAPA